MNTKIRSTAVFLFALLLITSCGSNRKSGNTDNSVKDTVEIKYAKGFDITSYERRYCHTRRRTEDSGANRQNSRCIGYLLRLPCRTRRIGDGQGGLLARYCVQQIHYRRLQKRCDCQSGRLVQPRFGKTCGLAPRYFYVAIISATRRNDKAAAKRRYPVCFQQRVDGDISSGTHRMD